MHHRPLLAVATGVLAILLTARCSNEDDTGGDPTGVNTSRGGAAGSAGSDPGRAQGGTPNPGAELPAIPDDTPRIRIALTGNMAGKLEPCGCASAQLGGLPRRMFFLREDSNFDLRIEGGNLIDEGNPLSSLKLWTALEAIYARQEPQAVYNVQGIGPQDLTAENDEFAMFSSMQNVPLVSADLQRSREYGMPWTAERFREFEIKGIPVRITGLTLSVPDGVEGYSVAAPQEAWAQAMDGASAETLRILMVHGSSKESRSFVALVPTPDLIIGINGEHTEPPVRPERIDGVPVVFPGMEGRAVLEVTLARLEDGPRLGYVVHELAGSKTAPKAMQDNIALQQVLQHRKDAAEGKMREAMAERFPTANGHQYVGSESCKECHEQDYAKWTISRHGKAWATLVKADNSEKYPWPTTKYPDCVECHTVGYGEQSGFVNPEMTPLLLNVGCEECHGAGSAHVANPEIKMGPVGSKKCLECHDHDQSPDFVYNQQWLKIEHGGK